MKYTLLLRLACLMLIIPFSSLTSKAMTIVSRDTVYGTVVDQHKNPIPGALVQIEDQSESAYTDIDGRFNIICGPNAKFVIVSLSKMPDIRKKIKPDMIVRMDLSGLSSPTAYQWFLGANAGISLFNTSPDLRSGNGINHNYNNQNSYKGVNVNIMLGRVKTIGWYAKYSFSTASQFTEHGPIVGGVFRLGAPIYICIGGGVSMVNLKEEKYANTDYNKIRGDIDFGFIIRVRDNLAVNFNADIALPSSSFDMGTTFAAGLSYFFNQ